MIYQGSCHCGDIAFEAEGELGPVVDCNCSHCSRKGALWWFIARDKLRLITPDDTTTMTTYRFNKHKLDHRFCKRCGCQPFGLGVDPQGNAMAAINARCLEDIDLPALPRIPYDGRST